LGDNIDTIKKNIETLTATGMEGCLELNGGRANYVLEHVIEAV
jgi:hypothetical protein